MKRILHGFNRKTLAALFLLLAMTGGTARLSAIDIDGKAPKFSGSDTISQEIADVLNKAFETTFDNTLSEIRKEAKKIDSDPEKLITAFGSSSVFASQGASQRGYGGYKLWAVTLGPMLGFQLPSDPFTIVGELGDLTQKLQDEHDMQLGLNPQILSGQVGLYPHAIFEVMPENLYLGIKFGFAQLDGLLEGFSFNTFSLGLTANYQLLAPVSLAQGLLVWRGINAGSGVIYQGTSLEYKLGLDTQKAALGIIPGLGTPGLEIDPNVKLGLQVNTVTIPLEVVTAVRLLWFLNITAGIGVDFGFGESKLGASTDADINVTGVNYPGLTKGDPGYLTVEAGGSHGPSIFNPKVMTGLGFNFGPVVIDIPVSIYLGSNGYSAGLTLGAVW